MCSGSQHNWGDRTFWSWHVPELHPAACLLCRQALAWWGKARASRGSSFHYEAPLFLRIMEEVYLEILWSVQQWWWKPSPLDGLWQWRPCVSHRWASPHWLYFFLSLYWLWCAVSRCRGPFRQDYQKFEDTGFCKVTWGGQVTEECQNEGLEGGHQPVVWKQCIVTLNVFPCCEEICNSSCASASQTSLKTC